MEVQGRFPARRRVLTHLRDDVEVRWFIVGLRIRTCCCRALLMLAPINAHLSEQNRCVMSKPCPHGLLTRSEVYFCEWFDLRVQAYCPAARLEVSQ